MQDVQVPAPLIVTEAVQALRGRAVETEHLGRLPDENIRLLREIGMPPLMMPNRWGGAERPLHEALRTVASLAHGCMSSAWVAALLAEHPWVLAHFPIDAQGDVWERGPDVVVCMSNNFSAEASSVPGGYRVGGQWRFVSGCDHADWFLLQASLAGATGEAPKRPLYLIPRADINIDQDSWQVAGLRGTGSKTLSVKDALVPSRRVLDWAGAVAGEWPGVEADSAPLFKQPFRDTLGGCLSAVAVGGAEAALELFRERITGRTLKPTGQSQASDPSAQMDISEASAAVETAWLLLERNCAVLREAGEQARQLTRIESAELKMLQAHAVRSAVSAIDRLFAASGGGALMDSNPLQRIWRDAHAVHAHASQNWATYARNYGSIAAGQEPVIPLG